MCTEEETENAFLNRSNQRVDELRGILARTIFKRICIEGFGDWGSKVYREALRDAIDAGHEFTALYRDVNIERALPFHHWERFQHKPALDSVPTEEMDLIAIVTPDSSHLPVLNAAASVYKFALVEKPFCIRGSEIDGFTTSANESLVYGVDHYPYYIAPATLDPHIQQLLGRSISTIEFKLTQRKPIERHRLPSLEFGLGYDMLPHFFALLVACGLCGSMTDLKVIIAGQHEMDVDYTSETFAKLAFTIHLQSGPIQCSTTIGKGCAQDKKILEVTGQDGTIASFDMGRGVTHLKYSGQYVTSLNLYQSRCYSALFDGLLSRRMEAAVAACLFDVRECRWMVDCLEACYRMLHRFRDKNDGWFIYSVGSEPGE